MPPKTCHLLGSVLVTLLFVSRAVAAPLLGDLDGNGSVNAADETLLQGLYGSASGGATYDPAADLDADGAIGALDLALFGALYGMSGGDPDTDPPGLLVTLADIPDNMNDLLVVPPEGFQITLLPDSSGGSLIDLSSLSVTNSEAIGPYPSGSELAPLFTVTPTRVVWDIPVGSAVPTTSNYLTASIRDVAGNEASDVYGYAVRDFVAGAPLENLQTIFLDFDQDRSLTPEIDFIEDLREYGLSSTSDPTVEGWMRDALVDEIVWRANALFGRNPDGSPGPDAANVVFESANPGGLYTRLCVGGQSSQGGSVLGGATMDVNNVLEGEDECVVPGPLFGVFPQGMDNLWAANPEFMSTFDPLDPGQGGTPVGDDPLDVIVTAPGFDPGSATPEQLARYLTIANAGDGFAQAVAVIVAHETGHLLGLVAHGPTPGGLYGGTYGAKADHNETPGGQTPSENYVMNTGGSFTFDAITGRNGNPLPAFRALNWAYLRDRVAPNGNVTGLFPAPTITSVSPDPVTPNPIALITIQGTGFLATPAVELQRDGDPTPDSLLLVEWVDDQTVTGYINSAIHLPGFTYDVIFTNPDDQVVVVVDGLTIQ